MMFIGIDVGGRCCYCGCTKDDLIAREDCIPNLYSVNGCEPYCFRCSDAGRYAAKDHYMDDEMYEKIKKDFFK